MVLKKNFGVAPHQIIEYLALMGDKSDNIPGVPSVGPKTAAKWLNEYETLDEIIKNAESIKGKVGEKFRAHLDQIPISKELTTIRCDLKIDTTIEDLAVQPEDSATLRDLYKELQFKTWLKAMGDDELDNSLEEIKSDEPESEDNHEKNYQLVTTKKDFNTWLKKTQSCQFNRF